jgi:hypothetical protein
MKQEDKDLLLKDIFGRIPYGVKCSYLDIEFNNTTYGNLESFEYDDDKDVIFVIDGIGVYSEHVKPYLFPLSSMTEEQKTEWDYIDYYADHHEAVDWLNKNHFDYRGLIDMGLAIDATNKNIY